LNLDYEIALNVLVYASLVVGLVQWRRQRVLLPSDALEAYQLLEASLKRAFPDITEGFTWREAVSRARNAKPDLDWGKIERDVDVYEAYRYGGAPAPPAPGSEFITLLRALRRVS
jgi:hypothetical protein